MTTVGVFAAIFDAAGRILCVHQRYAGETWTTPGGRLEVGESPEVGVMREVREETGLVVRVDSLIGTYAKPYSDDLVLFFHTTAVGSEPWAPDDEIAEWGYFTRDALPQPMRPTAARRIADAFAGRRGVVSVFPTPQGPGYDIGSSE